MPDRWDAVATLVDPTRRALFEYVRRQDHPVAREEAAEATATSRGLAAFHLDKLVDAGLLVARYQAPVGRRGRGRTPKVYEPAGDGVAITIPERRDDVIADILAEAYRGREEPDRVAYRLGSAHPIADLAALGFEPRREDDLILFDNCPFHALAARHGALICGMALAFIGGLADSANGTDTNSATGNDTEYAAIPAPNPGGCCVALRESRPPSRG
jgi:predicted ArsR family transcriptional regulator